MFNQVNKVWLVADGGFQPKHLNRCNEIIKVRFFFGSFPNDTTTTRHFFYDERKDTNQNIQFLRGHYIHPSIHPSIRSYYVKIELYSSIVIQFSGQMESRESRELESNSQRDGSLWNELYFRMQRNRWLSFEFEEDVDTSSATGPSLFLSYLGSFFNLFTWPCFEQSKKSVPSNDPEVHRTWP